jgi:hypothetical protein
MHGGAPGRPDSRSFVEAEARSHRTRNVVSFRTDRRTVAVHSGRPRLLLPARTDPTHLRSSRKIRRFVRDLVVSPWQLLRTNSPEAGLPRSEADNLRREKYMQSRASQKKKTTDYSYQMVSGEWRCLSTRLFSFG